MSKKLFIETLGCSMNVRDTEHIIAELKKYDDYEVIEDLKSADLIIINTCSVREKPVAKLFSELGNFNKKKKATKYEAIGSVNFDIIEKEMSLIK